MPEGQLTVAARFCGTRAGQLYTGGIYALEELKASGDIGAFGAGINNTGSMTQFLDHGKPPVTVLLSLLALAATGLGRQLGWGASSHCARLAPVAGFDLDFFLVSQVYSLMHHGHAGSPTQFCCEDAVARGGAMAELARAQERGMGAPLGVAAG
jgi:hypothetical protein